MFRKGDFGSRPGREETKGFRISCFVFRALWGLDTSSGSRVSDFGSGGADRSEREGMKGLQAAASDGFKSPAEVVWFRVKVCFCLWFMRKKHICSMQNVMNNGLDNQPVPY